MFSSFQDPGPVFPRHAPLAQSVGLDEWSPNGSTMYLVRYYLPSLFTVSISFRYARASSLSFLRETMDEEDKDLLWCVNG